jgi:DNA-3-methyladenine glycosylase I
MPRSRVNPASPRRCRWARDPLDVVYHDQEWGVPVHADRRLFELLILEGAQAGLSWSTILRKRAAYRRAFAGFDPRRVASFGPRDVRRLLADEGIVRNRAKVRAAIANARAFLAVQAEHGSFAAYLWSFVNGRPVQGRRRAPRDVPAETETSRALSADLRARGFGFVGPTICYAFMQAVGLVNDHTRDCFRHDVVARLSGPAIEAGPRHGPQTPTRSSRPGGAVALLDNPRGSWARGAATSPARPAAWPR